MADVRRVLLAVVVLAAACSGDDGGTAADVDQTTTTTDAPPQSAVDVSGVSVAPIAEGGGTPEATDTELPSGYAETELVLSGEAGTYRGAPNEPATATGRTLPYATRLLVRMPTDPAAFSGRVFVEPFNTSGGADADVVWRQIRPVLTDAGDAWIGVTVRTNSVELLQDVDAERYADLDVPANDVEWDVLRQLGGVLKEGGDQSPLGDARAEWLYLGGYSQSGIDVASFVGSFADDTRLEDGGPIYDGYLPAARSASLTPLRSGTAFVPTFVFDEMGSADVPVMDIESQSDVQGFRAPALPGVDYTSAGGAGVRLTDSDTYRLYEVAGMPHASGGGPSCNGPASDFPNPYFVRASAENLFRWAETGEAPPEGVGLAVAGHDGVVYRIEVDDTGNPVGGVRSPYVDVPLVAYSVAAGPGAICMLFGRAVPLDDLDQRYRSVDEYLERFTADLDDTIEHGFLREADRDELIDLATDQAQAALG